MTKRRAQKREKSASFRKRIIIIFSILAVLLLGTLIIYVFKPQLFRTACRRIERIVIKNPQYSDVVFPENGIVGIDVSLYQEDIDYLSRCFLL